MSLNTSLEAIDEPRQDEPIQDAFRVPKILVLDRVSELSADVGRAAQGLVPEPEILRLDRSTQVVDLVAQEDPDVLVVAPKEVTAACLRRMAQIHKAQPKVVILLSDNQVAWSPAQMAASGASDLIPTNPTRARLRTKLSVALETAQLRRTESVVTETVVVQESPQAPLLQAAPPEKLGKIFTVASVSGGSGKTFVATNLAAYLVKATGGKVLLVDLDLQFGEVAPSLHLHPERTIVDLLSNPEEMTANLADHLVDHACGFKVLCAPADPFSSEGVGPDEITALFDAARKQFDHIVVDTPPTLNESCLAAFDHSETLLMMASMDVPSLKNMRRFLDTLEKLNAGAANTALLLNKAESDTGIDLKSIEQLFPEGFAAVLPLTKQVPWSINAGRPIIEVDPKAEVSRRLTEGFAKLSPPPPDVALARTSSSKAVRRSGFKALIKRMA